MPSILLPTPRMGGDSVRFEELRTMVIIGANGSGKSQIGAQIERAAEGTKTNVSPVHRITAQRALKVPPSIQPRPFAQAESMLHIGGYDPGWTEEQRWANKFSHRWGDEASTRMLTDFEHVLAFLFADEAKRNRDFTRAAQVADTTGKPPDCKLDMFRRVWSKVMPQRKILVHDDRIQACMEQKIYDARNMSDGERVSIYLIGQCLCAPRDSVIIVDEPEIHLHKAIQPLLWDELEAARPDCAFIYITHDLDFASTRHAASIIWLRGFNGTNWEWQEITPTDGLPDALVLEVLGNRRPTLFVEGDDNSIDSSIYSLLFPERHIVSCKSCEKVIESTKAMRNNPQLHHMDVQGVVDRDRRSADEIAFLNGSDILVTEVAEIENLLCVSEVVLAVATQLSSSDINADLISAHNRVFAELASQIEAQSLARALAEIQFQLNGFGPKIGRKDAVAIESELNVYLEQISFSAAVDKNRKLFQDILTSRNYSKALQFFNSKGLITLIASVFQVQRNRYIQVVKGIVRNDPQGLAASAMRAKVPIAAERNS